MAELTPEEEAEIVLGPLDFKIDGETRHVPELKWQANRAWQDRMQATFVTLAGVPGDDILAGVRAMGDAQREIIRDYDVTGALGDLEDATETEIDTIYNRLNEVSFPQSQRRTLLLVNMVRQAVESAQASTPSSPSPTGTSAPTPLRRRSPSARSSSSGRRRASA
jgi:hypothetical protein